MLAHIYVVLACFAATGLAKVYENVTDLPSLNYDFVIVGGGAAGSVFANRLTENPNFSVLVLEAGVSNEGVLDSIVPFFTSNLLSKPSIYEWNYTTTPQRGLNGRVIGYSRAHLLGGCTSHNGLFYTRPSADDFDRYARLTDDEGWSWDRIFPYFLKNEKWTPSADHHNTHGQFDPAFHSTGGMVSVSLPGFPWPLGPRVVQATRELSTEFPFNLDTNSGKPLGVGWLQSSIGGGKRSSAATAYLAPQFTRRENLHILLHAQVSQLTDASEANGKVTFGGVQFRAGESQFTVTAAKEIILSAGTVGTAQILMNSGIGDARALQALGIRSVLDLPSVGQNVSDHPFFGTSWSVNDTRTLEAVTQNATRFEEAFTQWNRSHTGPFVDRGITHVGWLRLNEDSLIFNTHPVREEEYGEHILFRITPKSS